MRGIEVFCWNCGNHGAVNKVTAGLRCGCGSNDVDLWDGGREQLARVASLQAHPIATPTDSFLDFMRKQAGPATIPGWNEYQGPMPGKNPMSVGPTQWPETGDPNAPSCPVCRGSGFDPQDGQKCRECGGTGKITPNTTPEPPAVARHNYPSTQTKVPFMGQKRHAAPGTVEDWLTENVPDYGVTPRANAAEYPRADQHSPNVRTWEPREYVHEHKPLPLPGASCPTCNRESTFLQRDYKGDGWWTCPKCGPMANVDRSGVNPYEPGEDFRPNGRSYRAAKKLLPGRKTGVLLARIALIAENNPGLTPRETVGLAVHSVRKYSEAR